MSEHKLLKQAVQSALAIGATGSLVGMGAALAQTSAPANSTSSKATKLSQIIVTGSHIPRTSYATSQPVITITRQQIDATGFTSVGQILQNLSSAGASFNPQADFFIGPYSSGFESVNLHNLDAKRALILVNGHRWAPTLGGAVDLSSIPASIISRIEVLLDGASAIYGSDAVSGVINIITVKNFNGAEAHAYYGAYDAHGDGGGWDGKTKRYSVTLGTSSDNGGVLLSAGYRQFDPIWAGNRNISKEPLIGFGSDLYTTYTGNGYFKLSGNTNPNGLPCFTQACSGPLPPGTTPPDRVNWAPNHYLTIPSETWYGYAQGHYDLTDSITYSASLMYRDRNATQIISPTPLGLGATGFWFADGLPIGISGTNKYNPFGTDLVPAFSASSATYSAWCSKWGTGTGGGCQSNADLLTTFRMNPFALGYRTSVYDSSTWQFRTGFNGYFTLAGNQWSWDVSYGFSRNRVNTSLSGVQNTVNLQNALGPDAKCSATPGCVPLDVFDGQGGITSQMAQYVDTTLHNQAGVTQRDYTADVAGRFFNSWYAGSWGAAIGAEHLENNGFYSPDGIISSGNVTSNAFNPTEGKVTTNAEYGEITVPLASDLPMARKLSLDLANRWSQFKVKGGTGSGTAHAVTGRVGFKWQPIRTLLIRGTWSQSFREPSISEFFAGQAASYNNVVDPCISSAGTPPPGTYNCPSSSPTSTYGQVRVTFGGNPNLEPERATSRQIGFVWSPQFISGLDVNADYYKDEVISAVGTIPAQTIVNSCYLQNVTNYCNLINRRGPYISNILDLNLNTGSLKTNGWDVGLHYTFPTTPIGQFKLSYSANFVKDFISCNVLTATTDACVNYAGTGSGSSSYTVPKQRMNAGLSWSYGNWSAQWNVELIGKMYEPCANSVAIYFSPPYGWCSKYDANAGNLGVNELGTTVYHDVQASYTVSSWNTTFTVGINNLFAKDPPVSMTAFINNYLWYYYRIPGRFVYARVAVHF